MYYPLMDPPVNEKDFSKMSKKEAEKVFEWYTKEIPHRLSLLKKAYLLSGGEGDIFDYSSDSLKALWSWYIKNVNVVPKSEEEYQKQVRALPAHIGSFVLKDKVEMVWVQIAMDIGIYMALCLLKHGGRLKWGIFFKPRTLYSVNRPVIVGFTKSMCFDSMNIMSTQIFKVAKSKSEGNELYNLFHVWIGYVEIGEEPEGR